MLVKKAGGKVYGASLTAAEKKAMNDLVKRYEMDDSDQIWLCTYMLKKYGIDIEDWNNNKGDANER